MAAKWFRFIAIITFLCILCSYLLPRAYTCNNYDDELTDDISVASLGYRPSLELLYVKRKKIEKKYFTLRVYSP